MLGLGSQQEQGQQGDQSRHDAVGLESGPILGKLFF